MTTKTENVTYGDVNVTEEEMDMAKAKIRISTMIDWPVLQGLKKIAGERGEKYQTMINAILGEWVDNASIHGKFRFDHVDIIALVRRVEKLEKRDGNSRSKGLKAPKSARAQLIMNARLGKSRRKETAET